MRKSRLKRRLRARLPAPQNMRNFGRTTLAARPESEIDYSDIPPLSEEQLASAFRPKSKQLIAVRLDRDVLAWLKQYGIGYSTRVNAILRAAMIARRSA